MNFSAVAYPAERETTISENVVNLGGKKNVSVRLMASSRPLISSAEVESSRRGERSRIEDDGEEGGVESGVYESSDIGMVIASESSDSDGLARGEVFREGMRRPIDGLVAL